MWPSETPVWSKSSVDERNLYFARSTIISLAVETWRFKTEWIIITILHIIIITASTLNLGFKTIAPKVLAHTTCINRYWNIHNISSKKSSKTYCKIKLAELTAKIINLLKCCRPPTIHKNINLHQNVGALKCRRLSKCRRPKMSGSIKMSALMKYSKSKKQLRLYKIF